MKFLSLIFTILTVLYASPGMAKDLFKKTQSIQGEFECFENKKQQTTCYQVNKEQLKTLNSKESCGDGKVNFGEKIFSQKDHHEINHLSSLDANEKSLCLSADEYSPCKSKSIREEKHAQDQHFTTQSIEKVTLCASLEKVASIK